MLALDRPLGIVADLVLYGDHADPKRVYYVPTRPRVAQVGDEAELSFVKFRSADAEDGGVGLLSFTSELGVTEEQLDEARRHLVLQGIDQPVMGAIPFRSGKAVFAAALQEEDGFVEKMLGETLPDLTGGGRAVFSLRLTEEGARLVEAMLTDEGVTPLGVRYELEFAGLRPALGVKLRADYKRIYDELSWGFQVGVAYQGVGVRASVESATKKLMEEGAIEVEVMHFTDDADLRNRVDETVKWFQEKILEDMFESKINNPGRKDLMTRALEAVAAMGTSLASVMGNQEQLGQLAQSLGVSPDLLRNLQGGAGGAAAGASGGEAQFSAKLEFSFKDIREEELRTITLDWREARAEKRTAAPQGLMSTIGPKPRIIEVDQLDEYWKKLDVNVRPLGDLEALGVERLVVQLAYPEEGTADATQEAFVFEPETMAPRRFAAWTNGKPPRYRMHSEVHFAAEGAWPGPPVFTGEWKDATSLELAVHPLSDVPRIELELSPGTVNFEETPQVQIDVRIDGEIVSTTMLSQDTSSAVVRQRLQPRSPEEEEAEAAEPAEAAEGEDAVPVRTGPVVEARSTWYLADGGRTEGPWEPVEGTTVLVHAPWRSRRSVRVFPLLPPDFIDASITFTLEEEGQTRSAYVQLIPGERGAKVVTLPSLQEQPPPLKVDVLVVRGDGSTFIGETFETSDPVVLIRDRNGEQRRVNVRLLAGARLADAGVMAVQVQLLDEFDEMVDSVVFTESQRNPTVLLVPVGDDGQMKLRYRIVRYGLDGRANLSEVTEGTTPQLLVPAAIPASS